MRVDARLSLVLHFTSLSAESRAGFSHSCGCAVSSELAVTWLRVALPNSEVQCDDSGACTINLCVWAAVTLQPHLLGLATVQCRPLSLDDPVPEVPTPVTNQPSSCSRDWRCGVPGPDFLGLWGKIQGLGPQERRKGELIFFSFPETGS